MAAPIEFQSSSSNITDTVNTLHKSDFTNSTARQENAPAKPKVRQIQAHIPKTTQMEPSQKGQTKKDFTQMGPSQKDSYKKGFIQKGPSQNGQTKNGFTQKLPSQNGQTKNGFTQKVLSQKYPIKKDFTQKGLSQKDSNEKRFIQKVVTKTVFSKNKNKMKEHPWKITANRAEMSSAKGPEWNGIRNNFPLKKEVSTPLSKHDSKPELPKDINKINQKPKTDCVSKPIEKLDYNSKMKHPVKTQRPMPEEFDKKYQNNRKIKENEKAKIKEMKWREEKKKHKANKNKNRDQEFRIKVKKTDPKVKLHTKDDQIFIDNQKFEPPKQTEKLDSSTNTGKVNSFAKLHRNEPISRQTVPREETSTVAEIPEKTNNRKPFYPNLKRITIPKTNEQDERDRSTIHEMIMDGETSQVNVLVQYPIVWIKRSKMNREDTLREYHERLNTGTKYVRVPIEDRIKVALESDDIDGNVGDYDVEAVFDHAINKKNNREMVRVKWGLYWITLEEARQDYRNALMEFRMKNRGRDVMIMKRKVQS